MQSRGTRIALALGALAVVVVLFIVLQGGDDNDNDSSTTTSATSTTGTGERTATTGTPTVQQIVVKNAAPVGGVKKLRYKKGEQVRFRVKSDIADEIHVHGYDLMKDVKAGGQIGFSFRADIDGVFVIELEDHAAEIASLVVEP
jgi:hypothetical protein